MPGAIHDPFTRFGELLRYLRKRARLSQRALGQAVGYTGAHITRLEKGLRRPDPDVVRARFIDALDLRDERAVAQRLIALAAAADQEAPDAPQHPAVSPGPAGAQRRANLPAQLTSFIGRERVMAEVIRLLGPGGTRLLTLTGAGGAGKTRLAIEAGAAFTRAAAQGAAPAFADGVWLVELAPLSDPAGVPRAVSEALGLPDELGRSLTDVLVEYLTPRSLLLLLDNCEHLISACAELAEALLSACPRLRILATSREALRCSGEAVSRIPPLATPGADAQLALEQVAAYEAVLLFTERAVSAQPDFRLTQANAPAVARICARLDGIPLAIEMAAAQTAAMSAQEIAARLDDRFTLLTSGRRAALPRQRTLHATLEWSYNLLTAPERVLLARLSVFADGCTAELAQKVCADGDEKAAGATIAPDVLRPSGVLALLIGLAGKSLVVADTREERTRYRLLETVRQYAAEKLAGRGETDSLYRRMMEHLTPQMLAVGGTYEADWWRMYLAELGNVRNLIVWARSQRGHADIILRVACTFANISYNVGSLAEPLGWLEEGFAAEGDVPASLRAMCLIGKLTLLMFAGYNMGRWSAEVDELAALTGDPGADFSKCLTYLYPALAAVGRGDLALAEDRFERLRAFSRRASFRYGVGVSLIHQGLARVARGDKDGAAELFRQAFELGTDTDLANVPVLRLAAIVWLDATRALALIESELSRLRDDQNVDLVWYSKRTFIGQELQLCVQALLLMGDHARAEACALESLGLFRDLNVTWSHGFGIAEALLELGRVAWLRGEFGAARAYGEQCLELYLRVGDMEHAAQAHMLVGRAALGLGELNGAAKSLRRGLSLFSELNQSAGIVVALAGLAALAEARGDTQRAARLYGAADVPPDSLLVWLSGALWALRLASRVIYDREMAAARQRIAGAPCAAAWAEGRAMALEQAVDYALAV